MFKIHNNLAPKYLRDNLPPLRQFLYGGINTLNYRDLFCRTSRYRNSFYPDAIKIWNGIDHSFKLCNNICSFKKQINTLIRPTLKSTFGIFDPIGLNYLFRLRVGLSCLKYDKKKHNFADTPDDTCDCHISSEDSKHFLFHCSAFTQQRLIIINSVSRILLPHPSIALENNVKLLLCGSHILTFDENRQIVLLAIKFIKETLRFVT